MGEGDARAEGRSHREGSGEIHGMNWIGLGISRIPSGKGTARGVEQVDDEREQVEWKGKEKYKKGKWYRSGRESLEDDECKQKYEELYS